MMVDKALAFCKFTDGSFGRITGYKERKSISRVSIYLSKNKCSCFDDEICPM